MIKGLIVALLLSWHFAAAAQSSERPLLDHLRAIVDEYVGGGREPRSAHVRAGANLQAAIDAARAGDTITLDPGGRYPGAVRLPRFAGDGWITIRTAAALEERPLEDRDLPQLARLVSESNGTPTITTAPGAHHWRLIGLDVSQTGGNTYGVIRCGSADGYMSAAEVPHHVELDRVHVHTAANMTERRGIQTNCTDLVIRRSIVRGIKEAGSDAQAIGGWDCMARVRIVDNLIEGAGENILVGGAAPSKICPVPEDIEIRGNRIRKPAEWRTQAWQVKNLLELKNARRVTIEGNVLENNWAAAQTGFGVLFTVRGGARYPWAVVEDVTYEHNVLRNTASGINILGFDDESRTGAGRRITIRQNLTVINRSTWGGEGSCYMMLGGPVDIVFDHNTCIHDGGAVLRVSLGGRPKITGFRFTNNVQLHSSYGIIGDGQSPGNPTIDQFFVEPVIQRNVFGGGSAGAAYPATNLMPSVAAYAANFADYAAGNYALRPASDWRGAGTDGQDLGADVSKLPR